MDELPGIEDVIKILETDTVSCEIPLDTSKIKDKYYIVVYTVYIDGSFGVSDVIEIKEG